MIIEMDGKASPVLEKVDPKESVLRKIDESIKYFEHETERLEKIKAIVENDPSGIELLQLVGF